MSADTTVDLFRALADDNRLRILHVLFAAELSVAELVDALGLPQSTVSRHLKTLRDTDLVDTRRDGTSIYYRVGNVLNEPSMNRFLNDRLDGAPWADSDRVSVNRVLEHRKRRSHDFFEEIAGCYGTLTQPGGGWQALAAGLAAGFSGATIADLGAGEGEVSLMLARFASTVYAIDQSEGMLREVRRRAKADGLEDRVITLRGDLETLPLGDGAVDCAFLSQALHHAARPDRALLEAARIVRPGGRIVVLDLLRHQQDWVREEWADQWLGFEPDQLISWFDQARCTPLRVDVLTGTTPDLQVLLATAVRNETVFPEKP